MAPKPTHPSQRFWSKVEVRGPDDCWEWKGARDPKNYGQIWGGALYASKMYRVAAHRLSWEISNGVRVPEGRWVLHHCDNPPCVNPNHLYLGTPKNNAEDRGKRKRGKEHRQRGEANDNAKLTEVQVREIINALQRLPRESQASIAKRFGVKQPQISRIMSRKTWSHLW